MVDRRLNKIVPVWFGDIDRLSASGYCIRVILIGLAAWLYWESLNSFLFDWWSIDGYPTYVAVRLWLAGKSEAIYQLGLWVSEGGHPEWRRMLVEHGIPNAGTSFVYHPTYLLMMLPAVSALTFDEFVYFQLVLNILAMGVVVMESLRLAGPANEDKRKLATFFAVLSFPAIYAAYLGQNILPVLALILLSWRFLQHRQYVLASGLAALSIAMKVWVAPVVVLAMFMHGVSACVVGVPVLFLTLVVLPLLVVPELMPPYLEVVAKLTAITVFPYNNISVRAGLARLSDSDWIAYVFRWVPITVSSGVRYAETAFLSLTILAAGMVWYLRRSAPNAIFVAALSLLLIMPSVCWTHYLVFAIPAAIWLALRTKGWPPCVGFMVLAITAVPWHPIPGSILPRTYFTDFVERSPESLAWVLVLPVLMVVLIGFSILLSRRNAST